MSYCCRFDFDARNQYTGKPENAFLKAGVGSGIISQYQKLYLMYDFDSVLNVVQTV